MNERVTCRGQQYALLPEGYWHLTDPSGLVLNNAFVSEGICRSVFAVNRMPGLAKAVSPYGLRSMQDKKEQCWETARQSENDNLPSRIGAVFLLESEELAGNSLVHGKLRASAFGRVMKVKPFVIRPVATASSGIGRSGMRGTMPFPDRLCSFKTLPVGHGWSGTHR